MQRKGFILLAIGVLSTSCETLPRGFGWAESQVVVPTNFLYSGSDALDEWLDTSFKVHYADMSVGDVFSTHPLGSMRYRFEEVPATLPPFSLDSPGMTRRQLLYALSQKYDMPMSIDYVEKAPHAIVVRHIEKAPATDFYILEARGSS